MASGPAAAQEPAGHSPVILVIETDDGQSVSRSRLNVDAASDLVAAALQAAAGDWAAAPLEWLKAGRVARVLAKYLESHASAVRGKRVLELGAGTGVSGFACAAIGAALVNLSDQKLGLEALRESVRGKFEGRLDVVEGDWLVPPQKWAVSAVAFDVLVASDVVWLDDLIEPLVSVIAHFLFKPNKPILYLSHQTRSASVDLAFFAAVAQRGLACTEVDDFRGDWDFRPENITVFRIARATPAAPAPVPAVPTTPPTLPPPKPHLLVLVHGLHGSPADFKRLSKHLAVQGVRVHATAVNVWSTADGIDAGARRVADDVVAVVENERNGFASLSLVGHSLGGLYARAAAKLLATFRPELPRRVFATIASPHLGALPGPDSRLRPVYRFAAVVASLFSTTVRELTMNDGRAPLLLRIADDEHVDALEA
ncbi:putative serine esterase-domain-containing protein [Pelagophyceae sp. CCMP2097]|nr:putative serine esterase-domain-containing protein [Pelagophyceae sp. CCMP2097]